MAVKRERPDQGIPGQLHTRDGLVLKIRLPGEPEPTPEPANDTGESGPEPGGPPDEPTPDDTA